MVGIGSVVFDNPQGLWALLALVPFIIIYLIKPKPKDLEIPSLMFFIKTLGKNIITNLLRRLLYDILFFLQLLIILLAAFSVARPFIYYDHDITAQNTILIIDASASSQAVEDGKTLFEKEIKTAIKHLGTTNTVVIARERSEIGIKDANARDAETFLRKLEPAATETKLGEAIILAGEALEGKEGRVVVLSDFRNTGGMQPGIAKAVLESRGAVVDFINVNEKPLKNAGFIDLVATNDISTVTVKNFADTPTTLTLTAPGLAKTFTLQPKAVTPISFNTPVGVSTLTLTPHDAFPLDDTLHLSGPTKQKIKALLISNSPSAFLRNALTASPNVELTVSEPPIVSKENVDIYIIQGITPREVLPGTFEDLVDKVRAGKAVIIVAQNNIGEVDYRGLLPVTVEGIGDPSSLSTNQVTRFTKNIDFGSASMIITAKPKQGVLPIVSARDETPVLAVGSIGTGKVFYYGILETASDFKFSPSYPIFWQELLKYLTDQGDVRDLNRRTGELYPLDRPTHVKTPIGTITETTLLLDYQGVYVLPDKAVTANLLSEKESDLSAPQEQNAQGTDYLLQPVKERRPYHLEVPLLIAALILLGIELLYIKIRGDV